MLGEYSYIKGRIGWRGLAASEYIEDGPYLIAGNHIKSPKIMWNKCDHISEFRYNESPEIKLKPKFPTQINKPALCDIVPFKLWLIFGRNSQHFNHKFA